MNRKRSSEEVSRIHFDEAKGHHLPGKSAPQEDIEVTLLMGTQRVPLSIKVPSECNMKILKSILWFHLKKVLTIKEYNNILGFETQPQDYLLDYQLENGLGMLTEPINLTLFLKNTRHGPTSLLNYKICKLVSEGGFSKVYLLRNHENGEFVVGKFMLRQGNSREMVGNEYKIALEMDHPFIIKTHNLIETEFFFVIVMEYAPGGELFELLKTSPRMNEQDARFFVVQTLLALKYLHSKNIIYRDVKPENIILDKEGHIKLTDFGLAKKGREKSYSFCGSLDYMAPEVINDQGYSFGIDHYSVGILMYELMLGAPPFYHPDNTSSQTKYHILNTHFSIPQSSNLSSDAISLLSQLLNKDPSKRLGNHFGIDQILHHRWFSSVESCGYPPKAMEPPVLPKIKIDLTSQLSSPREIKEWQWMIEKDMRQMQIKASYHIKNTHFKRFQSAEDVRTSQAQYFQAPKHSREKTNMSLLQTLTCQKRKSHKKQKSNGNLTKIQSGSSHKSRMATPINLSQTPTHMSYTPLNLNNTASISLVKTVNHSRKSSINSITNTLEVLAPSKTSLSKHQLKNNFIMPIKKMKEGGVVIRKKRREPQESGYFKP